MKKVWLLLLMWVMLFAIVGCGGSAIDVEAEATEQRVNENNAIILPKLAELEALIVQIEEMVAERELGGEYQQYIDESKRILDNATKSHNEIIDMGGYLEGTAEIEAALDEHIEFHTETLAIIEESYVTVQWPEELDGIPAFRGFTPNFAFMAPDGLVTVDYSDVTDEDLDEYRRVLLSFDFEPIDLGTGVEAHYVIDDAGTTFLVVINPQKDVEGHLQISGIIVPKDD